MNRSAYRPLPHAGIAGVMLILCLAMGCQRVAPIRTLPSWVRGIYIPMFTNKTFEPQIEEAATRLTQEEFLADGRVDIVPKDQADLVLKVELLQWNSQTVRTRGDYIARTAEVTLTAAVRLYDPFDLEKPMADLGTFRVSSNFNTDTRSNRYEPEPDRKARLLLSLADQIVMRVLSGFPANLPDLPPGVNVPQFRTPETIPVDEVLQPRPTAEPTATQPQ